METNSIYTTRDTGLSRFYGKIYSLVGMGIGLSAFVSYLMLGPFSGNMLLVLRNYPWLLMVAAFAEIALVFVASSAARRNTPAALPLFLSYSALNGFTLSFILAQYTQASVFQAFVSSALVFFVMAAIGAVTKKDLSGVAKFAMAAIWGIIIASLVNIFLGSSGMSFIISIISVLIFAGLIAYDNQLIKRVYDAQGGQVADGWAVSMALSLYLDFINLFLNLLRIFGSRD